MNPAQELRVLPPETFFPSLRNRFLQALARSAPGATSLRVQLHRWRGVKIGDGVRIGLDVIFETAYPQWIAIGDRVQIGVRTLVLAHIHGLPPKQSELDGYVSVRIEDDANIGPGVTILPHVTIGRGAVVTAGSVVSRSIPPLTLAQGNPARPIATCQLPLRWDVTLKEFYRGLRPMTPKVFVPHPGPVSVPIAAPVSESAVAVEDPV
ncbi:MAG TPA: acyltransferase [Candidatus Acidoferrales bacterium]|nr:acyltransferase [Candidatus Acidoferrales bacterium]